MIEFEQNIENKENRDCNYMLMKRTRILKFNLFTEIFMHLK